jgi:hypothetical protein
VSWNTGKDLIPPLLNFLDVKNKQERAKGFAATRFQDQDMITTECLYVYINSPLFVWFQSWAIESLSICISNTGSLSRANLMVTTVHPISAENLYMIPVSHEDDLLGHIQSPPRPCHICPTTAGPAYQWDRRRRRPTGIVAIVAYIVMMLMLQLDWRILSGTCEW